MNSPDPFNPQTINIPSSEPLRRRRKIRKKILLGLLVAVVVLTPPIWWYNHRGPVPQKQIYRGVTYTCERLTDPVGGEGLMHVVEVDLNAPGIGLYVTPVNPEALAKGWEYRVQYVSRVARLKDLAAVINGTLFTHEGGVISMSGDFARSIETVVSDHDVNHIDPNTYLMWFEDDLTPHVELSKPPPAHAVSKAKWAIGAQQIIVHNAQFAPGSLLTEPDARTAIGVDPTRRRLWLMTFERASQQTVAEQMIRFGVKDGMLVDGGTSTAMALGSGAAGVRSGTLIGNWRPVATQFGVKALPVGK